MDQLFDRIADGDSEAMEHLFARERAPLFRFFWRLARCEQLAEDLLQNTFLNLWRYRSSFRNRNSASAYLYKVALNQWRKTCTKEVRQREAHTALALEKESVQDGDAARGLVAEERAQAVWEAIETLPEAQRVVLVLHRFQGLSCTGIAEATGEGIKTVESRLRLALKKLTDKLELNGDLR